MLNRCSSTWFPCFCTNRITSERVERSNRKWMKRRHFLLMKFLTSSATRGWSSQESVVKAYSLSRMSLRACQVIILGMSSTTLQFGDSFQRPSEFDELLHNASVLLPERRRAWTVAITVLVGQEADVVHSGWGVDRDINSGWKNSSDNSGDASALSACSQ